MMMQQPMPPNGASGGNQEIQRLESMLSIFNPAMSQQLRLVIGIATAFLDWISLPLEILTRWDFGERYLGMIRIAMGVALLDLYLLVATAFSGMTSVITISYGSSSPASPPVTIDRSLIFAVICVCVIHRLRMSYRQYKGIPWFSRSFGVSYINRIVDIPALLKGLHLPLLVDPRMAEWSVYRWIEPLFWYLVSVYVRDNIAPIVGSYMVLASGAMFLKAQIYYYAIYDNVLDMNDSRLLSQYLNDAASIEQKPSWQTAGIPVTQGLTQTIAFVSPSPQDAASGVHPNQRSLFDDASATNGHKDETAEHKAVNLRSSKDLK